MCWSRFEVGGPLDARDQQRLAPVALLAAVEQVERLGDPPALLVLLERDRPLVEERLRVGGCVPAVGHRHPPEVLRRGAVLVHVAGGEHRHPLRRRHQPERRAPREAHVEGFRALVALLDAAPEPVPRALVERPIAQHVVGRAGPHRHGGLGHHPARGAAAVVDHREVGELGYAEVAGHLDLGVLLGAVDHHAVDLARLDAGVGAGGDARLGGELHRRAAGVLRELGGPDADDGGLAGELQHLSSRPRADRAARSRPCRSCGRPTSWRR